MVRKQRRLGGSGAGRCRWVRSVASSRPSNRACGFPADGLTDALHRLRSNESPQGPVWPGPDDSHEGDQPERDTLGRPGRSPRDLDVDDASPGTGESRHRVSRDRNQRGCLRNWRSRPTSTTARRKAGRDRHLAGSLDGTMPRAAGGGDGERDPPPGGGLFRSAEGPLRLNWGTRPAPDAARTASRSGYKDDGGVEPRASDFCAWQANPPSARDFSDAHLTGTRHPPQLTTPEQVCEPRRPSCASGGTSAGPKDRVPAGPSRGGLPLNSCGDERSLSAVALPIHLERGAG